MRYSDVIILIQNHHRGNCPSRHRSPRHYARTADPRFEFNYDFHRAQCGGANLMPLLNHSANRVARARAIDNAPPRIVSINESAEDGGRTCARDGRFSVRSSHNDFVLLRLSISTPYYYLLLPAGARLRAITERAFKALIELLVGRFNSEIHPRARTRRYKRHVQRAHFFPFFWFNAATSVPETIRARALLNAILPRDLNIFIELSSGRFIFILWLRRRGKAERTRVRAASVGYIKHKMP